MSRREAPGPWQLAVAGALGAAAIGLVVAVTVRLVRDGAGTGDPLDVFRALGDGLSDPTTWQVVGWCALGGAVVSGVVGALGRRRRGGPR
ncbi:hypothetical protein ACFT5B_05800 [Luteimicrobium sp. NPDC057192]|uniref:hypothetical protein n=1 Tax=Luteimicrobium sp. NPDC057192 TaxID=3346042 RepID=UPI003631293B